MEINQLVSNGGATAGIEDFKVVENKKGQKKEGKKGSRPDE